ncbi:hypothetical protein V8F33_007460 [Rhypophila sp. PSN 637]
MADSAPEEPTRAWTVMPPPPTPQPVPDTPSEPQEPAPSNAAPTGTELPAAFPRKRRGRPPGRPNMTVRETDYEDNVLVQAWNAAKLDRTLTVVPIFIRDALTESVMSHESQRNIFRMPSREMIYYVQGWITARHIASKRPSYVNGLLIHSRGADVPTSCNQCVERRAKNALGPFLTCRSLQGSFHNSCSNCKWFDNTSLCSLYTGPKPNRKRKAKELTAPVLPATQANGTETNSNGDSPESATPNPTTENTEQLGTEDINQTSPPDLSGLPYDASFDHNDASQHQADISMGGTDTAQQHPEQSGSPAQEVNEEAPQPDEEQQATTSVSDEQTGESPVDDEAEHEDEGDTNSVDAQLAAQLLPELSRQE